MNLLNSVIETTVQRMKRWVWLGLILTLCPLAQSNSCLPPLDDEVNLSGPALRPVFMRASQTPNQNELNPMNLGEGLRSAFYDVEVEQLTELDASRTFLCSNIAAASSPSIHRDSSRLSGPSSGSGKRFQLLVTLSGSVPLNLAGQPDVGAKLFLNDRLLWSTDENAGTWDGIGSPCDAMNSGGTFQVPMVMALGERIDLRIEHLPGVVNYGGADLLFGHTASLFVTDVTVMGVEEDPRSRCDGCRFEGCGVASVGSDLFEMSVGTQQFDSPRMGLIGRLRLDEEYLINPTSKLNSVLYYFDQAAGYVWSFRDPVTDRIEYAGFGNGMAHLTYTSEDEFRIDWYSQDQATKPPTGSPDRSYLFDRSTAGTVTTITIDEVFGATTLSSQIQYDSSTGTRTLDFPGNLRRDVRTETMAGSVREVVYEIREPLAGNLLVSKEVKRYQDLGWGEVLISTLKDPDNGGELITYTYVTSAPVNGYRMLDSIASSYGPKVFFDYDFKRRIYREYWGWKDQPANEIWDQGRTREYSYSPISGSPDDGSWKPSEPRAIREYIDGDLVRKSYLILDSPNFERTEVQFSDDGWTPWTDTRHPRKITNFETAIGPFQGFPINIYEENLWTNIAYSLDLAKDERTTTVTVNGATEGQITTQIHGIAGHLVKETVTDFSSSIVINETDYGNFDELHRPELITYDDGTTEVISYGCCGIDTITDRDSVLTSHNYDDLKRRTSETRLGITHFWDYDAADNILSVRRKGTDASEVTLQSTTYGLDGKATSHTNALQGSSQFAWTTLGGGQMQHSTTVPDGGTILVNYYLDGQLASITGTAVNPESFTPSTEAATTETFDPYFSMVHRRTALDDQGIPTNEWIESLAYQDGRQRFTRYADAVTPKMEEISYFAGWLRPAQLVDADGVIHRFAYDFLNRLMWTGIDVDANQWFEAIGPDRIFETLYDVTTYTDGSTYDVVRTQKRVYPTNGSDTSVLQSESLVATDGLRRWDIAYINPTTQSVTKTEISYSGNQRTETITHPSGRKQVREFADGRLITEKSTDSNGAILTHQTTAYDDHGRVESVADLRTGTTDLTYNDADQVVTVTTPPDPDNVRHTTTTIYDTSLRPKEVIQPDGTIVHTQYDLKGQVIKTFGSRTYPVEFTYDSQGRKRTMTTWQNFDEATGFGISGSATTRWNYDPYRGWLISKDYPDEITGQPPATEGIGGPVYTYTAAGKLATRTWQRGVSATYAYDPATGELDTVTYSDGTATLDHDYNRQGQVTSITQGAKATSYTYDDMGNVTTESVSGGPSSGLSFTRTLDAALRPTLDQLDLGAASLATTSYGYNTTTGRLGTVSDGSTTAAYAYLANSDLIQTQTFGTGELTTTRAYDNLNRLTSISNAASGEAFPLSYAYTYNLASQRTRTDEADGKHWTYQYDSLGQLTQGNHRLSDNTVLGGQDFDYTFDEIGNRTSTGGRASADSTYTVNQRNEYDQRTVADVVDILGIDDPTSTVTVEGQTATRSGEYFHSEVSVANANNPVYPTIDITTTSNGGQSVDGEIYVPEDAEIFTHDADGNLLSDGRWHYTWDAENRLTQMHTIAGVPLAAERRIELEYDHQGRRIAKKVYDRSTGGTLLSQNHYYYDGWNLVAETDSAGTLIRRYLWGTDLSGSLQGAGGVGGLLAVIDHTENPAETHYLSYDGNGNAVSLTDPTAGTWSARYEYGPFGEPIRTTGDPIAFENPFRFSTKYMDVESGFLNYGRRLYNPTTGRWLSKDPIEEDGGLNLYGFVLNNPINAYDILGLYDDNWLDTQLKMVARYGVGYGTYAQDRDTRETYRPIDEQSAEDLEEIAYQISLELALAFAGMPPPLRRLDDLIDVGRAGAIANRLNGSFFGMTQRFVLKNKPKDWKRVPVDRGEGWKLVDRNGYERVRWMKKPTNMVFEDRGPYWHRQDQFGRFLDENGNVVPKPNPQHFKGGLLDPEYIEAEDNYQRLIHIPYTGRF